VPIFIGRGAPLHDFARYRCRLARSRRIQPPTAAPPAVSGHVAVRRMSLDALWPIGYIGTLMVEVRQTEEFSAWLRRLRDANAVARIIARIRRMEKGNSGDSMSVGLSVLEMRID
jgi:hypothetical protein